MRCVPFVLKNLQGSYRFGIILDKRDFFKVDAGLAADINSVARSGNWIDLQLVGGRKIQGFYRKELIEIFAVGLTVLLKVLPSAGNVCSGMEHHDAVIQGVTGCILFDYTHDATDKLHERR